MRQTTSGSQLTSTPWWNGRGGSHKLAAWILVLAGCGVQPTNPMDEPRVVATVQVEPSLDTLRALGATVQLNAVARDASGDVIDGKTFTWSSSDRDVLTVSDGGVADARRNGAAIVIAAVDGIEGVATLTVAQAIATVTVEPGSATIDKMGETQQFTGVARDENGHSVNDVQFLWLSSDPGVVTIDPSGVATARGDGVTTITAAGRGLPGHAEVTVALERFVAVSAGADHSCAVTVTGSGWCWGMGQDGRLGNDAFDDHSTPAEVTGEIVFVSISAGGAHSCGLTSAGEAYCWGNGVRGQLGGNNGGPGSGHPAPVPVTGGHTFVSISSGARSTCGVTTSGKGYCWGSGTFGQLGTNSTSDQSTPSPVAGGFTFAAIGTGRDHSCGLTTDGDAYCWGLGRPDGGGLTQDSVPIPVSGSQTFESIAVGGSLTCAVTALAEGYCWGEGSAGQLGNGLMSNSAIPVQVAGGLSFMSITAGRQHACGLTVGGAAYCWGEGQAGQLGNGGTSSSLTPVRVSGGVSFTSIDAGRYHTCGVSVSGDAYCWGAGGSGRLGDGSPVDAPFPVRVPFP